MELVRSGHFESLAGALLILDLIVIVSSPSESPSSHPTSSPVAASGSVIKHGHLCLALNLPRSSFQGKEHGLVLSL